MKNGKKSIFPHAVVSKPDWLYGKKTIYKTFNVRKRKMVIEELDPRALLVTKGAFD